MILESLVIANIISMVIINFSSSKYIQMNNIFIALILFAAINISVASAATPQSFVGGSGLGLMRTAEVLGPGESSWFINTMTREYESYVIPGDSALDVQTSFGYARSFGGNTEISLSFPYAGFSTGTGSGSIDYSGARGVLGVLKHSFTDPVYSEGGAFAVTLLFTLQPGDSNSNVTSGEKQHAIEFNFSHWMQSTGYHLNVGYGRLDKWADASTPPYYATDILNASTGIEIALSDSMTMSLQALLDNTITTQDQSLLSSAVFTYSATNNLNFTFGGAWGVSNSRSRPNTTYMFGISYSPQATRKSRYYYRGSTEELSDQNQTIIQRVDTMDDRMQSIENSLGPGEQAMGVQPGVAPMTTPQMGTQNQMAGAEPPSMGPDKEGHAAILSQDTISVELLVPNRYQSKAEKLESFLRKSGYKVAVHEVSETQLKAKSHIYYRMGLSHRAVELGHKLKGNQIVSRKTLTESFDLQLELGSDLLQ